MLTVPHATAYRTISFGRVPSTIRFVMLASFGSPENIDDGLDTKHSFPYLVAIGYDQAVFAQTESDDLRAFPLKRQDSLQLIVPSI